MVYFFFMVGPPCLPLHLPHIYPDSDHGWKLRVATGLSTVPTPWYCLLSVATETVFVPAHDPTPGSTMTRVESKSKPSRRTSAQQTSLMRFAAPYPQLPSIGPCPTVCAGLRRPNGVVSSMGAHISSETQLEPGAHPRRSPVQFVVAETHATSHPNPDLPSNCLPCLLP